ncbi:MAG: FtsH protease activity modulator HflK [Caulobacter sp.]|jgi:membrane protease subunit HflK|nr:FtsH protease activity modulator HflK [Caulobacter sp.]
MPWNDNSNPGPWGSPPPNGGKGEPEPKGSDERGPRRPSGPGRGPGRTPPDLGDLQRRLEAWIGGLTGGRGGGAGGGGIDPSIRKLAPVIGGALVALYLASGIIVVGASQEAVVTTFGAWTRSYTSGIGYHLPIFEKATKVDVTSLRTTSIGGATGDAAETLMLTGDENIVDLSFAVTWRVSNPGYFLFNIAESDEDPEGALKAVAESAMREVVGRTALDPIISTGRSRIQIEVAVLMQEILDRYQAGITIDGVQLNDPTAPKQVLDAFRDVNNASQNAESYANQARGEASQIRQSALGYQAQVVREAAGEAARFNQVYEQYKLAPGVTRDRLYIETMERVLRKSNKVIIDGKGATAPIILPPDAFRPRVQPAAPQAATPAAPAARAQGGAQ